MRGGGSGARRPAGPYRIGGGGGGVERGRGKHVLVTDCTSCTCSFPFHPSFSYHCSAAEASLDTKRLAWSRTGGLIPEAQGQAGLYPKQSPYIILSVGLLATPRTGR